MTSQGAQALLQPHEEEEDQELGFRNRIMQQNDVYYPKHHLKSLEILKSAVKIITSNTKFMLILFLSILPLFVFMVFYEIKILEQMESISNFLKPLPYSFDYRGYSMTVDDDNDDYRGGRGLGSFAFSPIAVNPLSNDAEELSISYTSNNASNHSNYTSEMRKLLSNLLQPFLFYLFLYPLLEFFSIILTLKIAAKLHATDKPATLSFKEMLINVINPFKINFKGAFITYISVHLMLTMTLLGLLWAVSNHFLVLSSSSYFDFMNSGLELNILSITVHSLIFLGLLYKYLDWSAFWNMSIVISVIEEQSGIAAFELSGFYGKHCRKIGFQLMLGFFVFGHVLRLLCLYARLYEENFADVWISCVIIMLIVLGSLVKWVAFLLYFYCCKQQIMEKKVDDHNKLEKSVNAADMP